MLVVTCLSCLSCLAWFSQILNPFESFDSLFGRGLLSSCLPLLFSSAELSCDPILGSLTVLCLDDNSRSSSSSARPMPDLVLPRSTKAGTFSSSKSRHEPGEACSSFSRAVLFPLRDDSSLYWYKSVSSFLSKCSEIEVSVRLRWCTRLWEVDRCIVVANFEVVTDVFSLRLPWLLLDCESEEVSMLARRNDSWDPSLSLWELFSRLYSLSRSITGFTAKNLACRFFGGSISRPRAD